MKNRDLVGSVEAINQIAVIKELSIPLSFALGLNLRAVKEHLEIFEEQKKKIVEDHTLKGADGKPLPVKQKTADGKLVLDEETGDPVVVPGARKFDDPEATDRAFKELLDLDVTDEVVIRKIKLSRLKDEKGKWIKGIDPSTFTGVPWMFLNDVETEVDELCEKSPPKPA